MAIVQVDSSNQLRGSEISYFSSGSPPHAGPYAVGGKLYILGFNQFSAANTFIRMFVSTDDGATYAEANAAGAPIAHNRLVADGDLEWRHYDAVLVGTKIYVLYTRTDATLAITAFDTSWGTNGEWTGTILTGGPTVTAESIFYLAYDPVATKFTAAYQVGSGGPNAIKYQFVSLAGTWGGENTAVATGPTDLLLNALIGGYTGTSFWSVFIYRSATGSLNKQLRSISLTAAGALGTSQLIDTRTDATAAVNVYSGLPMDANAASGFTMMAIASWDTGDIGTTLTKTLKSYTATPALNPTWAALTLESNAAAGVFFLGSGVAAGSDGNIYAVYYNRGNTIYYYNTYTAGAWVGATILNDLNFDFFPQNQSSIATGSTFAVGVVMNYGDAGDGTSFSDTVNPQGFVTYIYKNNLFSEGVGEPAPPAPGIDLAFGVSHFTFAHGNHQGIIVGTLTNGDPSTYPTGGFTLDLSPLAGGWPGVTPAAFQSFTIRTRNGYRVVVTLAAAATRTISSMGNVKIYTSGGVETADGTSFAGQLFDFVAVETPIRTN